MMADNSFLYGKGVFTTVAVRGGEPFLWDKHWRRLKLAAERTGIGLNGFAEADVLAGVKAKIAASSFDAARVRITFSDRTPSSLWPSEADPDDGAELSIIAGVIRPVPTPFRVTFSPFPVNSRSPIAGIKTCNYLEPLLAIEEARGRGYNEAIRMNERGHIVGGCMANIFWGKGGRLFTPALVTGCLAGTTREFVTEALECNEIAAGADELIGADMICFTSAGLGVTAVNTLDGRELRDVSHPIMSLLGQRT